ncbi:MAG: selenocysteine-specific translation elongation factor [Candidatus Woesearchaeota archaeon]
MHHIILGTAGHIDHGKSALVKALTGIDPDRLKEEKERGITIDLGFAYLKYTNGLTVGIVDVPGHERLVRNMLAGAGGIDIVLFVVAADEGIMPQSIEHFNICNLLKIKSGIVAITKCDLVDKDWLDLVRNDVKEFLKDSFLENSEIINVSTITMENIELLKEKIKQESLKVNPKSTKGIFRLPIDRVFTLKGFGTVVTGTVFSGKISVGEEVDILPCKVRTKIRGLHCHGQSVNEAYAGQRVAINLQGVDRDLLKRGDTVVNIDRLVPAYQIDAKITLLSHVKSLKNREIVHFHIGTSEKTARTILYGKNELKAGETCYCQFRLNEPVITMSGDRFIIRRVTPIDTIGGGEILDPSSYKISHRKSINELTFFDNGTLTEKIALRIKRTSINGIRLSSLEGWINADIPEIHASVNDLRSRQLVYQYDDMIFHSEAIRIFQDIIIKKLVEYHKNNPIKQGIPKEELRNYVKVDVKIFNSLLLSMKDIHIERELVRLSSFKPLLNKKDEVNKDLILQILNKTGTEPPNIEELSKILNIEQKYILNMLKLMEKEGLVIKISNSIYVKSDSYQKGLENLRNFFREKPFITVREFKDIFPTNRKCAIHFLEYLDSIKMTKRVGDARQLIN